jgi:hypothetical protein
MKWVVKLERILLVSLNGHWDKNFIGLCLAPRQLTDDEYDLNVLRSLLQFGKSGPKWKDVALCRP